MRALGSDGLDLVRRLSEVGIALSAEKDEGRLLERILESAMDLTGADGGTLYLLDVDADTLDFRILRTRSLGVHRGGTSRRPVELPSIPLHDEAGHPNHATVAARAAITGQTIHIPDAYAETEFDLSGPRTFDAQTGYRSVSFLTVPMRDHEDEVIGVLQLINALAEDGKTIQVFDDDHRLVAESLASQAAIALTNKQLIDDQRRLFESFIKLLAGAIDQKSPYTGGHCRRVPELTLMLADAADRTTEGALADFSMTDEGRYELEIAAWLHDCGKVTTPEYVVDKATKLQTIFDRIELVRTRFEILRRDLEIQALRDRLAAVGEEDPPTIAPQAAEALDAAVQFLERANQGGEAMAEEDRSRVRALAVRTWRDAHGEVRPLLTDDEVENLTVERGTLTPAERDIVNHHITATIEMLESLPYPRHLRRVPELAGGHHERMDGKGYPRGLTRDEMTVEARAMAIADVFEALTAADRPYKDPMRLSEALQILGRMAEDAHVDADLFRLFVREKVYLVYAQGFLDPEQIDEVDEARIPGL